MRRGYILSAAGNTIRNTLYSDDNSACCNAITIATAYQLDHTHTAGSSQSSNLAFGRCDESWCCNCTSGHNKTRVTMTAFMNSFHGRRYALYSSICLSVCLSVSVNQSIKFNEWKEIFHTTWRTQTATYPCPRQKNLTRKKPWPHGRKTSEWQDTES